MQSALIKDLIKTSIFTLLVFNAFIFEQKKIYQRKNNASQVKHLLDKQYSLLLFISYDHKLEKLKIQYENGKKQIAEIFGECQDSYYNAVKLYSELYQKIDQKYLRLLHGAVSKLHNNYCIVLGDYKQYAIDAVGSDEIFKELYQYNAIL